MSEIIKKWIAKQTGIVLETENNSLVSHLENGKVLARIIHSYGIIDKETYSSIEKLIETEHSALEVYSRIRFWLKSVNINVEKETIKKMFTAESSNIKEEYFIKFYYNLYINLVDKDKLMHIIQRRSNRLNLNEDNSRFKVEKVEELDPIDEEEKIYVHFLVQQDIMEWQRYKHNQIVTNYKENREKYLLTIEGLSDQKTQIVQMPKTTNLERKPDRNLEEIKNLPSNEEDEESDCTFEQLIEMKRNFEQKPRFRIDPRELDAFVRRLREKRKYKVRQMAFLLQTQKRTIREVWQTNLTKEEDHFEFSLNDILLNKSQSSYEKFMIGKLYDVRSEKDDMMRNKVKEQELLQKKLEQEIAHKTILKNKQDSNRIELCKMERSRMLHLESHLYEIKQKLEEERTWLFCEMIVSDIVEIVLKLTDFKENFEAEPPKDLLLSLTIFLTQNQPIQDYLEQPEDILQEYFADEDEDPDLINVYETIRFNKFEERKLEDYHKLKWPWKMTDLDENEEEMLKVMELGSNVLSHIVHWLTESKHVRKREPETIGNKPITCLMGIMNPEITLPVLQKTLRQRNIKVFQVQDAIDYCMEAYEKESDGEELDEYLLQATMMDINDIEGYPPPTNKKGEKCFQSNARKSRMLSLSNLSYDEEHSEERQNRAEQTPEVFPEQCFEMSKKAHLGLKVNQKLGQGDTIPDELVTEMIVEYMKGLEEPEGWVIVGYPIDFNEAKELEEAISGKSIPEKYIKEYQKEGVCIEDYAEVEFRDYPTEDCKNEWKSKILPLPVKPEGEPYYETIITKFIKTVNILEEKMEDEDEERLSNEEEETIIGGSDDEMDVGSGSEDEELEFKKKLIYRGKRRYGEKSSKATMSKANYINLGSESSSQEADDEEQGKEFKKKLSEIDKRSCDEKQWKFEISDEDYLNAGSRSKEDEEERRKEFKKKFSYSDKGSYDEKQWKLQMSDEDYPNVRRRSKEDEEERGKVFKEELSDDSDSGSFEKELKLQMSDEDYSSVRRRSKEDEEERAGKVFKKQFSTDDKRSYDKQLKIQISEEDYTNNAGRRSKEEDWDSKLKVLIEKNLSNEIESSKWSGIKTKEEEKESIMMPNVERFYANQGCYYKMKYKRMNFSTIKHLAKLIIGDYDEVTKKSSMEIIGDAIFYIPDELLTEDLADVTSGVETLKIGEKEKKPKTVIRLPPSKEEKGNKKQQDAETKKNNKKPDAIIESVKMEEKEVQVPEVESEVVIVYEEPPPPPVPGEPEWNYVTINIPKMMKSYLAKMWMYLEEIYTIDFGHLFFREHIMLLSKWPYRYFVMKNMRNFYKRPSDKQKDLLNFQMMFNEFDQDMREDDEIKAELHMRVHEFRELMNEKTLERKQEAEEERRRQLKDHWEQMEMCELTNVYVDMMQIEFERTYDTLFLLSDYYTGIVTKMPCEVVFPAKKQFEKIEVGDLETPNEIVLILYEYMFNNSDLMEISNPLLEFLDRTYNFANQRVDECASCARSAISKLAGFLKKKTDKGKPAAASGGKGAQTQLPKFTEPDDEVAEASETILQEWNAVVEAEILRIRFYLNIIYEQVKWRIEFALTDANEFFQKLEREITEKYEKEMMCIDNICELFLKAIEAEVSIQPYLVIDGDVFYADVKRLMVPNPLPEPEPPLEEKKLPHLFQISHLQQLLNIFKNIAPDGFIPTISFVYLLNDMIKLNAEDGQEPLVPSSWKNLETQQVEELIKIVFGKSEFVSWKEFMIHSLEIQFPTEDELLNMRETFLNYDPDGIENIKDYQYNSITFWFENQCEVFDANQQNQLRTARIKSLIYSLYQINEETFNYSAMLLGFCKDEDPIIGLAKAFCVILGKKICWNTEIGENYLTFQQSNQNKEEIQDDDVPETCQIIELEDENSDENDEMNKCSLIFLNEFSGTVADVLSTKSNSLPDLVYELSKEVVIKVLTVALPWYGKAQNLAKKSLREKIETVCETLKKTEFHNSVLVHELLRNERFLHVFSSIDHQFKAISTGKAVQMLLKNE